MNRDRNNDQSADTAVKGSNVTFIIVYYTVRFLKTLTIYDDAEYGLWNVAHYEQDTKIYRH